MAAATRHLLHPALPKSPTFRPTTAPSRLRLLGHPSWGETRPPPGHVHLRSSGSPGAEALQLALSAGYNVHLTTEEGESDEVLLRRFRREVSKAGVIPEGRRRRFYESTQEEKKRKAREAGLRNRRRHRRCSKETSCGHAHFVVWMEAWYLAGSCGVQIN